MRDAPDIITIWRTPSTEPTLARQAVVSKRRLVIDGQEFPWLIAEEGIEAAATPGLHRLTVTILVEAVTFEDTAGA